MSNNEPITIDTSSETSRVTSTPSTARELTCERSSSRGDDDDDDPNGGIVIIGRDGP